MDEYAKKVSPALSGTPTAPTAAKTVNNTQIATTAFVHLLAGAANNGGIVDSLLAQNGYVKFANGLILQWRNNPGLWAIPFTEFVAGGITMTRTGSQSSGTWYGDSGTISLTGYTASCATNESWVSSISGSAIAVGF